MLETIYFNNANELVGITPIKSSNFINYCPNGLSTKSNQ